MYSAVAFSANVYYYSVNFYAVAADLIVFLHLIYVSFTVGGALMILGGGLFGWAWIRNRIFRFIHLGAVLLVAIEAISGIWCPLTVWEWRLRALAGQDYENHISFVGRLIRQIIFIELPDWGFTVMYVGFGALVLGEFLLFPPDKRKK